MKLLHATQIATKGVIGWTVGLATKGYIVWITETPDIAPPRTSGPGGRGFREKQPVKGKVIKVTVFAYGKKWESTHAVANKINVGIEDIEVIERGEQIVEIKIRNIK